MSGPRVLALLAVTVLLGCVEDKDPPEPATTVEAEDDSSLRCPPCGMRMDADTPLREIAGLSWAVCNERCAELIAEDPEAFRELAVR